MSLFKTNRPPLHELVPEAQKFLAALRVGRTDQEAAEAAGVTIARTRAWLRDPDYSWHYERARRGEGGAQIWSALNLGEPDRPDARLEAIDRMLEARQEARLDALDRRLDAALDEAERQAQLGRYQLPESDQYGRMTGLDGWLQ